MNLFFLTLIPWLSYVVLITRRGLHMLQQNLYDNDLRYFKWIKNNLLKLFGGASLVPLLLLKGFFIYNISIIMFFFVLVYSLLFLKEFCLLKKEEYKKPLVITARIKRLIMTTFLIYLILLFYIIFNFKDHKIPFFYNYFIILGFFQYFLLMIVVRINIPLEKCVYYYYLNKAKRKIKGMPNLKVIGITGSYGKTSSKNILSDILNIKYNALATPKNLNTPYGLMISINNHLSKFEDIFIAEMGAYHQGEIKELCNIVYPKYGILTKIGEAHLELFGSKEIIQKTKFELIESLPEDGIGVLNKDDKLQVNYPLKNRCRLLWIGIEEEEVDVLAKNIKINYQGIKFDVLFKGDKKLYHFETKLLGYENVYNILAGIALGYEFGLTKEELIMAVRMIKPIPHRLDLKKIGDLHIIDDAYNSNPLGSKMALEVLKLMPGKKIIVTPGMIELGEKQEELNKEFGKQIALVCDEVILIGKDQTKPIYEGLKIKKHPEKDIYILNDVKKAFSLLKKLKGKETYVLLENDLPDIFSEE